MNIYIGQVHVHFTESASATGWSRTVVQKGRGPILTYKYSPTADRRCQSRYSTSRCRLPSAPKRPQPSHQKPSPVPVASQLSILLVIRPLQTNDILPQLIILAGLAAHSQASVLKARACDGETTKLFCYTPGNGESQSVDTTRVAAAAKYLRAYGRQVSVGRRFTMTKGQRKRPRQLRRVGNPSKGRRHHRLVRPL